MRYSRLSVLLSAALASLCTLAPAISADEAGVPKSVYIKYHDVLKKAQSVDEIKPFLTKERVAQIESTPKDQADVMFQMIKEMLPEKVEFQSEAIDGDKAKLEFTGETAVPHIAKDLGKQTEKQTGKIDMVREDGNWKIGHEDWKGEPIVIK